MQTLAKTHNGLCCTDVSHYNVQPADAGLSGGGHVHGHVIGIHDG